jgi:DNA-binding response OmpR family regulator
LVIDDNHYLRDVLRAIFEREGADVLEAVSVEQAQALLNRVVPDAIVTDLELRSDPPGGVVILQRVKQRFSDCAVLLLTGRTDAYDTLCRVGFDAVLLKPTPTTTLIAAVLAAIGRRRREPARDITTAA